MTEVSLRDVATKRKAPQERGFSFGLTFGKTMLAFAH